MNGSVSVAAAYSVASSHLLNNMYLLNSLPDVFGCNVHSKSELEFPFFWLDGPDDGERFYRCPGPDSVVHLIHLICVSPNASSMNWKEIISHLSPFPCLQYFLTTQLVTDWTGLPIFSTTLMVLLYCTARWDSPDHSLFRAGQEHLPPICDSSSASSAKLFRSHDVAEVDDVRESRRRRRGK